MATERYYAYDVINDNIVYRIPGKMHGDGQLDSDDEPVWLSGDQLIIDIMMEEDCVFSEELEEIDPDKPHCVTYEYK